MKIKFNLEIELDEGKIISLSESEAKALHYKLNEIFGGNSNIYYPSYPVYPSYPTTSCTDGVAR